MFNVGRFDPRQEASKNKKGKSGGNKPVPASKSSSRKRKQTNEDDVQNDKEDREDKGAHPGGEKSYVIAPEAKEPTSGLRKHGRIEEEAFDDMELEGADLGVESHSLPAKGPTKKKAKSEDAGVSDPSPKEISNAIRMSNLPIEEAAKQWNLAGFLVENLQREGFSNFFPIQALVIPDVIASERYSYIRAQDICVAAPTGSGKTLAFVLPILNSLAGRKIKRLRALVVLPSRDLGELLARS